MGNQTSTTTEEVKIPEWMTAASQRGINFAGDMLSKPFQPYTGPRTAGFVDDQREAFGMVGDFARTGGNGASALIDQGVGNITAAGTAPAERLTGQYGVNGQYGANGNYSVANGERIVDEGGRLGAVQDYISPYIKGVLDPQLANIGEASAVERNRIGQLATRGGGFGDARHGVLEAENALNTQRAVGEATGTAYQSAYDRAMSARAGDIGRFGQTDMYNADRAFGQDTYNTDRRFQKDTYNADRSFQTDATNAGFAEDARARQMQAGQAQIGAAVTGQNAFLDRINQFLGIGQAQQQQTQNEYDAGYEGYQQEQQHPFDVLNAFIGSVGGVPYSRTNISTEPRTSPIWSILGSVLGSGFGRG